jgi:RNA 3'-terminal phosphate cyclase-like protein
MSFNGSKYMRFEDGAVQFRLRLAVSILSGRPVLIRNIRAQEIDGQGPGLRDYEASFLRLLDGMTNGSSVEINSTGTQLKFKPGILLGGTFEHPCPHSRSIGWFLEGLLPLCMFGKEELSVEFHGITDGLSQQDPSPDYIITTMIPLLKHFGVGGVDGETLPASCKVHKRGAYPKGGGVVQFFCPSVKELLPINLTDVGMIKRVRGTAISCRISPSSAARVAYAAKGLCQRLIPDVWIHTNTHIGAGRRNKEGCGPSPSLSLVIAAESTTGIVYGAEYSMSTTTQQNSEDEDNTSSSSNKTIELPEDVGLRGAALLLEEVRRGGCVDTSTQSLALLLMCLGPEDVARIRLGTLSKYTIHAMRTYKQALGVEFKLTTDTATSTIVASCLGSGYVNMTRAST